MGWHRAAPLTPGSTTDEPMKVVEGRPPTMAGDCPRPPLGTGGAVQGGGDLLSGPVRVERSGTSSACEASGGSARVDRVVTRWAVLGTCRPTALTLFFSCSLSSSQVPV